jgi:GST-like protein
MNDPTYEPPEVWRHDKESGGRFAGINRPTAGAREEAELPKGKQPFQLYTLATPNGVKASIMLEELLETGHDAEYDAWPIDIGEGNQFTSGFLDVNPNSKIPALIDRTGPSEVRVFESGAILFHLAEKFGALLAARERRAEMLSWLFWQVGSAPSIGGGFGHFYAYAPEKYEYPINRYAMETKRLFDVADRQLADNEWLTGDDYSIADIAVASWFAPFVTGDIYNDAKRFLSIDEYEHVERWAHAFLERPAVRRGLIVGKTWGPGDEKLPERHSAKDFADKKF